MWLLKIDQGKAVEFASLLAAPLAGEADAAGEFVLDAVELTGPHGAWKFPAFESNSCTFAHGLSTTQKRYRDAGETKVGQQCPARQTDEAVSCYYVPSSMERYALVLNAHARNLNLRVGVLLLRIVVNKPQGSTCVCLIQLLSVSLLQLLLHQPLVEATMIDFLLSQFGMKRCKREFKKNPDFTTAEGTVVSTEGLFRALVADVISEAFFIDISSCGSSQARKVATKASIACANLKARAKLRQIVRPILADIANDKLEDAREKARRFKADFEAAVDVDQSAAAEQVSAKAIAVMSVSLCK